MKVSAFQVTVFEIAFFAALLAAGFVVMRGRNRWFWMAGILALAFLSNTFIVVTAEGPAGG